MSDSGTQVRLRVIEPGGGDPSPGAAPGSGFLAEWAASWSRLPADERDPFSHPVWLTSWIKAFGDGRENLFLYAFYSGGTLAGVVPLEVRRRGRGPWARHWLAHPWNGHAFGTSPALPSGLLGPALAALLDVRLPGGARPTGVIFQRVDGTSPLGSRILPSVVAPRPTRSVLELHGGYESILAHASSKFRQKLKRTRRKSGDLPGYRFSAARTEPELETALEEFAELEARGWKGDRGSALLKQPRVLGFYRAVMESFSRERMAVIHSLRAGGDLLASSLGLEVDGVFHGLKIAYNPARADVSPSYALVDAMLEDYCRTGSVRRFDTVVSPDWFERWHPEHRETVQVVVFPFGPAGAARRGAYALKTSIRGRLARRGSPGRRGAEERA